MSAPASRAKAYLVARQKAVRKTIKELKLDALLLTHPGDLAYLTDFSGHDSIGVLTANDLILITDFRYKEQAQIEAPWLKVVMRDGKMSDRLAEVLGKAGVKKVGFETNFTSFGQIDGLKKSIKEKAKRKIDLLPLSDVMVNIRKIKDEHEIAITRKSVKVAEQAFLKVRKLIKPGLTENELAGRLIAEMRSLGASNVSFEPIIATGANSSLPHYRPGDVKVKNNQPLLFDWGAIYGGYCSDLTRTMIVGKASPKMKEIYNVCLKAQLAAIAVLGPGVTTKQADSAARDLIAKAGYKDYFGHGLGHGIGKDIHELPTLRHVGGDEELKPGMIVTVEPGIYLPGVGGVRIEDDVLITSSGCEVLSSLDKSFAGAHLS